MLALHPQFSAIPPLSATCERRSSHWHNPSQLALPRGKPLQIETTLSSFNGLRIGLDFPSYNQLFLSKNTSKCRKLFESHFLVHAAWTRRSKGEGPKKSRKSFKQRTEKFMKPFMLDVFISSKYVHAKVMHRVTSKVVSVATTNAKDLRNSLPSLTDVNACKTIGKLIADRSKEADVYAVTYELRKGEKMEGKLAVVVGTLVENGIALV